MIDNLLRTKGTVFFTLILLGLFVRTCFLTFSSNLQDFSYYLTAATHLTQDLNPYLVFPPQVYPPASLFLFIPFSLLPYKLATAIWTSVSILSLFVGLYIFINTLIVKKISKMEYLLVFLITFQTFPVKYGLAQGQINFIVFLGMALFLQTTISKQHFLSAIILAIITTLKFNPLLFIVYLLIIKQYKTTVLSLSIFSVLNLLPDLIFKLPLANSSVVMIYQLSTQISTYYFNQSLLAFIGRIIVNQTLARSINFFLIALLWLTASISFLRSNKNKILLFLLVIQLILITSPISWQHYSFWSVPASLYHLYAIPKEKNRLATILLFISIFLINSNLKSLQFLAPANPIYSHILFGNLLLYGLLTRQLKT